MTDTAIPYCSKTWSWVTGCDPVHIGCEHCWARRLSETRLLGKPGHPPESPFDVYVHWDKIEQPCHWRTPQDVMTSAHGDVFHRRVPYIALRRMWDVMAGCQQHAFYVFTKRTREAMQWSAERERGMTSYKVPVVFAPDNVMLIASVSDQLTADTMLPDLLRVRAVKHYGVSIEPMLGPVDLSRWVFDRRRAIREAMHGPAALNCDQADSVVVHPLEWVIVGCESGPGRRPMDLDWVRAVRDQCASAGVPFFLKQIPDRSDSRGQGIDKYPLLDGVSWRQLPPMAHMTCA